MEVQLWDLFRETGEPMGYLLYRAKKQQEKKRRTIKAEGKASAPPKGTPPASV